MDNFEKLIKVLLDKGMTISSMESCTGGGFVNGITNVPRASEVLKFSAVTYSNEYKIKMGVDANLIEKYSVYSIEVAKDMSKKISIFTNSDYGVGITGKINRVDKNNMYGDNNLVYVSIYDKNNNKYYEMKIDTIDGNRQDNKNMIITKIVNQLLVII